MSTSPQSSRTSGDPGFKTLTIQELTALTQTAYLLKTIPEGFTLQIVAANDQPKDQPFAYETNYTGPNGETFGLMAIGLTDEGFIKSNFYDGSYKSASGLVVYYSTSSHKDFNLGHPDHSRRQQLFTGKFSAARTGANPGG